MHWNKYFMAIAKTVALKSKDPNTKVGVVIVDEHNRIVSTGYNGMPRGIKEDDWMWQAPAKYDYVIHAELNAILYAKEKGYKLYSTMYPCKECAKIIAAAGIKEVFYVDDKYDNKVSASIFNRCGISIKRVDLETL